MTRPGALAMMWSSDFPDDALGGRIAGQLGVGGVGQEQQHALGPELGQPGKVGGLAADGRVVELEVAAVDDGACGRAYDEPDGVGDAVADREKLHLELARVVILAAVSRTFRLMPSRVLRSLSLTRIRPVVSRVA